VLIRMGTFVAIFLSSRRSSSLLVAMSLALMPMSIS